MNRTPVIPYRFAFGPVKPAGDPTQPFVNHTTILMLTAEIPITRTDPDSLCRSVAMSLKALCRPQAVAQIAQQLQAHLLNTTGVSPAETEPKTKQEPTMPKITIGAPTIDQPDPRDPEVEVEITPGGTKLTQLNFESQLTSQSTLPNLDPLSEEAPK